MSHLIVPSLNSPEENGCILQITPESAGWTYVGFEVYVLSPGQKITRATEDQEVCIVLLSGMTNVTTSRHKWDQIGKRMSIFEQTPPYAIYVPSQENVEVEALTDAQVAVCLAPGKRMHEARLISPDLVGVEMRGSGNMERRIHNILPEQQIADSLLVVEVFTPGGHWSSYPPHKHDENRLPQESYLEETYYHRINPAHGFATQRVYTDDHSLDETMTICDGDAVMVPRGYHPVSAAPGYDLYYLNVMAGPVRTWKFKNDVKHEWLIHK